MKEDRLRQADSCCGIEKGGDFVTGGVLENDFLEEGLLSIATAPAILGVLIVVEGVVGGLAEVAAPEDEAAEVEVKWVEKAFPFAGSEQFRPFFVCNGGYLHYQKLSVWSWRREPSDKGKCWG